MYLRILDPKEVKAYSALAIIISICCILAVIGGALLKIGGNSWGNVLLNIGLGIQVLLLGILVYKMRRPGANNNAKT